MAIESSKKHKSSDSGIIAMHLMKELHRDTTEEHISINSEPLLPRLLLELEVVEGVVR
jgi:hypothetical protein